MKKADLQRIARETGASLSDILEIQTVYNDGNDIVFLGRPKIFPAEFRLEAATRLTNLGYRNEIYDGNETVTLMVFTGTKLEPKVPWLNIALFLATVVSTMITGAMYYNVTLDEMMSHPVQILKGWPYSFWLLAILGFHEFGHYLTARYRQVKVTLPYFIPAPTMLGTLGAFIRLKSPLKNRGELLEVGAMGPVAGFSVSIIAIVAGLKLSNVVPEASSTGGMILGDSLLFTILSKLVLGNLPQGMTIMLDPVAFAGWVGLLVTMLNMLPLGQLDGGHILYAMFGRRQFLISRITMLALVALAIFLWTGWGVWVIFGFLMRPNHPPTLNDSIPLTYNQKLLGWFSILIFALCFIPVPMA